MTVALFFHSPVSFQQLPVHTNIETPPIVDHVFGFINEKRTNLITDPLSTVPQHKTDHELCAPLWHRTLRDTWLLMGPRIHCRSNSSVTRKRVTLEFKCHPKSGVAGFQLSHNILRHSYYTDDLLQFPKHSTVTQASNHICCFIAHAKIEHWQNQSPARHIRLATTNCRGPSISSTVDIYIYDNSQWIPICKTLHTVPCIDVHHMFEVAVEFHIYHCNSFKMPTCLPIIPLFS